VHNRNHATKPPSRAPIKPLRQYWEDESGRRRYVDDLFDGTARNYDSVERLLALGSGARYRRQALQRSGLKAGMRVLDIATGTGLVAREALATVGPTGVVIGLDPSAGMLGEARSLGIPLVRALGERLPCADASFDFVSMGFALRHVADLDALFAEIRRVLKPGGTACILEITRPRRSSTSAMLRIFMTRIVPAVARVTRHRAAAQRLIPFYWNTIEACVRPETVLAALRRGGFRAPRRNTVLGMFSEYVATADGP
jgi:demethylmenaquinone methyltransferase/2-methoxy-6-polyprenyl-1,4-benzoquinol methylase